MKLGRRQFLASAGAALAVRPAFALDAPDAPEAVFPASVRADFPSVAKETYLNSAAIHPVGTFAANALKSTLDLRLLGPGEGRVDFSAAKQDELKKKYGALINAKPSEIAYTANTTDGENIVVMGLFGSLGGPSTSLRASNIVIDELHFTSSLYMYKEIEKKGVELRIVKHRNWAIDPKDMDKAIDRNTRLV